LHLGDGGKHDYQSAQTVIKLTFMEEYAKINELTGKTRLPGNLVARAADKSICDSIIGTIVWHYKSTTYPQGLTQLFQGMIKIFSNDTENFVDTVAIVENRGQVAGLELKDSVFLCHLPAYKTHLMDILLVNHPDNFTSVVVDPFDPKHITDFIRLLSKLSFLHVKSSISQKHKLRQVHLSICETRRKVAATRHESIARCAKTPLHQHGCLRGSHFLCDPKLRDSYEVYQHCGATVPDQRSLELPDSPKGACECHQPFSLPIAAVEIDHDMAELWGLGRSI
jgi:hypothetical protein